MISATAELYSGMAGQCKRPGPWAPAALYRTRQHASSRRGPLAGAPVAILSACYSGVRDESLHSLPESLSQSSITTVGMWVEVEDRAAVVYDVEFLRAYVLGRSVACSPSPDGDGRTGWPWRSVACASVPLAMEYPAMAGDFRRPRVPAAGV